MWQPSYYDRIIRNEEEYLKIWQYSYNIYIGLISTYQPVFIYTRTYAYNIGLLKLNQTDFRKLYALHQLNLRLPFPAHFF